MSGYRCIHRDKVGSSSIWSLKATELMQKSNSAAGWRLWSADAEGSIKSWVVKESTTEENTKTLDASALSLDCSHQLGKLSPLGCSRISTARNYVGDDKNAGELLVASLQLSGKVQIWTFPEDLDNELVAAEAIYVEPVASFNVENASGVVLEILPPRMTGVGDVLLAVGCLDGTIALVATGLVTAKATKDPTEAGTIISYRGSGSTALCLSWNPKSTDGLSFAVGREDGTIDILNASTELHMSKGQHRLPLHKTAVRAVSFTSDGSLLLAGSDDGFLSVWDVQRKTPTLVQHVVTAHQSWIIGIAELNDGKRFATAGADRKIHIWDVGQMYQPVHSFQSDEQVWCIQQCPKGIPRMITGGENGSVQIYSLEISS